MIRLPRWFVTTVAVLLVLNPAIVAVIDISVHGFQYSATAALGLYLFTGVLSILYFRRLEMPLLLAIVNLVIGFGIPSLVNATLPANSLGTTATWYVSGVSTLMAITAIRQHKTIAWVGTLALVIQVFVYGGVDYLFNSGLGGAIALVAASHAISTGLQNSAKQRELYLETAKATEAATAADSARRQERSKRIAATLQGTLPMLVKIASGQFTDHDRQAAKILEAQLRDEIRGRALVTEELKAAIYRARVRGVEVVVLDEGGLDGISIDNRLRITENLAKELDQISEGRVAIRARQQGESRVSFVASRSGSAKPDRFIRL